MKNLKKKAVVMMTSVSLAAGMLTGCAGGFNNKETAVVVGGDKVPAGVANFYARYQQASIETNLKSMLGDNMWAQEVGEGKTYEQSMKESIMETIQQLYILEDHMKEYEIALTDAEKERIDKAVYRFDEDNRLESKELVSGEKEYVKEVLTLLVIQDKMKEAMTKDVNTEVSDEEAAKKALMYVRFPFTSTDENGETKDLTDEEKEALKETAAQFLEGAKTAADFNAYAEAAGYTATKATFDKNTTSPDTKLIQAADALGEGAFTEVIEAENGLYVAKVTSMLDREATDNAKKEIVNKRKQDKFNEIYEGWKKDTKIEVDEEVWAKVDFQAIGVTIKPAENKYETRK